MKTRIKKLIKYSAFGSRLKYYYQYITKKIPEPDYDFPQLLSLEIASACNLRCIHCPPQSREFKGQGRKLGLMEYDLFQKLMDEIDEYGPRRVALHKDGEPLMHPKIKMFLERVKKNINHKVYLTTNAHYMTKEISDLLLELKIDIVNLSIGAASKEFYEIVRGKNFKLVMENIEYLLSARNNSEFKPRVIVQIINLPEFEEMEREVKEFKRYWSGRDVEIQIWDKLNWGVYEYKTSGFLRYPCYSLWESFNVNSDGNVTACCMDWKQNLLIGNVLENTIHEVWHSEGIKSLRQIHIDGKEQTLPICDTCNYWQWQPRLKNYSI